MDEKIKIWIQKQHSAGRTDDQIRAGLKKSGWTDEKIAILVPISEKSTKKLGIPTLPRMNKWVLIGIVSVLLIGLSYIFFNEFLKTKPEVFTFETCLENDIPESACSTLESLLNKEPLENWVSAQTLAVLGDDSTISDVLPNNIDVSVDVSTWLVSDIESANSATVCAHTDTSDYLVLLTNEDNDWKVEITLELDENGTNPLFGDTSYCNDA